MKEQALTLQAVAHKVLDVCKELPEGVSQETLSRRISDVSTHQLAEAINLLLKQHKVEVYQSANEGLVYKYLVQEQAAKFKGLSSDELLVYQIIQSAQNMGIWTRDLKLRSNLQQPQVVKVLKVLESRKLIKAIKSVTNKNRKVYMIYELEPSREVTGGAWYTENEFDHEFIKVLRNASLKFVLQKRTATLGEIREYIKGIGISKIELREEDIKSILNILVYDGKLDEKQVELKDKNALDTIVMGGKTTMYIPAVSKPVSSIALTDIPCGRCPVAKDCKDGGIINPKSCVYLDEWLANAF